ncbi:MAG: hypothetical protein RBT76_06325 [candidate division Zixibacteria bacterium]|jgi:hypothetical protein|nr:hypothetical protein [candidate division Zixibacteria bacterium]
MAHYRSTARRALTALLTLCLIVGCTSTSSADVVLPAEFYFGRWAHGIAVDASGSWVNERPPYWTGSLSYTVGDFQAGVNGLRYKDYSGLTTYSNEGLQGFVRWRPADNWQLGMERFGLTGFDMKQQPSVNYPDFYFVSESDEYGVAASLNWSRRKTVVLDDNIARYAYYVGRAAGPGDLVWYALGQYSHDKTGRGISDLTFFGLLTDLDTTTSDWWSLRSDLTWGISRQAFINVTLLAERESFDQVVYQYDGRPEVDLDFSREQTSFDPAYDITAVFVPAPGAFVTLGVSQDFQSYSRKVTHYALGDVYSYEEDGGLMITSTAMRVSVDAITEGEFNPQILLDDYLGYYHGILARNQQHVHLGFFHEWPRLDGRDSDDRHAGIDLGSAIGVGSGAELTTALDYRYDRTTTYVYYVPWYMTDQVTDESVRWTIGVRWRSYEYTPGTGPGWANDSPMDIAFGPVPRARDFYVAFSYQPPALRATDTEKRRSFLSLSGLDSDGIYRINGRATAGVGEQATVSAMVDLLATDGFNSLDLTVGGAKRIDDKFQLSLEASRTREAGEWNDPELTVRLAGLF